MTNTVQRSPALNHAGNTRYEILNYILTFTQTNHFPPTIREITSGVGLCSTSTTYRHMQTLIQENLLIRQGNRARAIVPSAIAFAHKEVM